MVDERALYEALAARRLHAAGLDVWWSYPASYAQAMHALDGYERTTHLRLRLRSLSPFLFLSPYPSIRPSIRPPIHPPGVQHAPIRLPLPRARERRHEPAPRRRRRYAGPRGAANAPRGSCADGGGARRCRADEPPVGLCARVLESFFFFLCLSFFFVKPIKRILPYDSRRSGQSLLYEVCILPIAAPKFAKTTLGLWHFAQGGGVPF